MKTLTSKIPDSMNQKLRKRAATQKEGFSETVHRALAKEFDGSTDFASLAAPYQGMFHGLANLSMREGYARPSAR